MANYFVAGVGRALLFKGDQLFADCRTLADSSITIGVTAEDIRGGEGNALFGQYYHDASFSMKLTDIMFNLDYIAANTGASKSQLGNVFYYEPGDVVVTAGQAKDFPNAVAFNGSKPVIWAGLKNQEKVAIEANDDGKFVFQNAGTYCVMYRKAADNAETITISSQFIPEQLHAVLTVALYSGDNCNAETATKAGEVVIDIPRLQLNGAMDISMTATGAAQTPLEGIALASGCTSCDGKAIYATITKSLNAGHWYDDAQGLIIEDLSGMKAEDPARDIVVYAYYANKAPKKIDNSELTLAGDGTVITVANGKATPATAGNGFVSAICTAKSTLETAKAIVVAPKA